MQFLPGKLLASRYRIVSMLGRGGMGEVYRADDLRLRHPVALKLLPVAFQADESRLEGLLNEVRLARRVTHPNVCRVHDVGEAGGRQFLTMEYIDGEDLASLLRRIGHLPRDKAMQIGRELCAGLAAAHAQGILHGDLKPANVMVDGRGRALITDFGLARSAASVDAGTGFAGTPGYLAPERLAGQPPTVKSDLYALGLVLYQLFTGHHPFDGNSGSKTKHPPPSLSSRVDGLDPTVDASILSCLETDPDLRPSSARRLALAFPDGDPLSAALAAGDTPSPGLVADAQVLGRLRPGPAIAAVLGTVLLSLATGWAHDRLPARRESRPAFAPAVFEHQAASIARDAGFPPPADTARGFSPWPFTAEQEAAGIGFWYREGADALVPVLAHEPLRYHWSERVSPNNPPPTEAGMVSVSLMGDGALVAFLAGPVRDGPVGIPGAEPDWAPLFASARLDLARFSEVVPDAPPPVPSDARRSWVGSDPARPEQTVRVDAASLAGRPAYFVVQSSAGLQDVLLSPGQPLLEILIFWITLVTACALAVWNWRRGRIDLRGSARLAAVVLVLDLVYPLLLNGFRLEYHLFFVFLLAVAIHRSVRYGIYYAAIEPHVRRFWPRSLISWTRLIQGRLRDPMVGRDILLGSLAGSMAAALYGAASLLNDRFSGTPGPAAMAWPETYEGARGLISTMILAFVNSLYDTLIYVVVFVIIRLVLRSTAVAGIVFVFLLGVLFRGWPGDATGWLVWTVGGLGNAFLVVALIRLGLLAALTGVWILSLLQFMPLTLDFRAWSGGSSVATLVLVASVAVWGAYAANRKNGQEVPLRTR